MRRGVTAPALMVSLACAVGCAGLEIRDRLAHATGQPIVVIDNASFDGEHLKGRVLMTSDAGDVVVDGRLTELAIITVDDVFDCDGGATVPWLAADALIDRPKPGDFQVIRPEYWYGANFSLLMYDEVKGKAPPPDCVQVLVAVNFAATAPGADRPRLMVQARLNRPDAGVDDGSDAGTE